MSRFKVIESKNGYLIKTKDGCILGGISKFDDSLPIASAARELIELIRRGI